MDSFIQAKRTAYAAAAPSEGPKDPRRGEAQARVAPTSPAPPGGTGGEGGIDLFQ